MPVLTLAGPHVSRGRTIQYRENRILAALPKAEFERLAPHLTRSALTYKRSLSRGGEIINDVCFPDSGVCSVMSVMRTGATAEVGTIGNEGVTGVALFFGDASDPSDSLIQVPGSGRMLPASEFRKELARGDALFSIGGSLCTRSDDPDHAIRGVQRASFGRAARLQVVADDTRSRLHE